jgi:N4-gp56 family major capsid protein
MADEVTSSIGSELYTNILQEAIFTATEQSVARAVARNYNLAAGAGKTFQVPVYPSVSAGDVTEGTDMSNTAVNPTSVTITLAEIGVMATVTDLMLESSPFDVAADIGNILGRAVAEKVDTDFAALFSSFSTSLGNDATEFSASMLFQAAAQLRSVNAPGPYYCVVHPKAAYALKKELATNGGNNIPALSEPGNQALQTGVIGSIAGITVVEHSLVPTSSSDGYVGAVFSRDAIGVAVGREPRLEQQRDASLRASELVMTMTTGEAILKNTYGVTLLMDGLTSN